MYVEIHFCFYTCFIDVQWIPEDDHDRSKHVGIMNNYVYKYNDSVFVDFTVRIVY